jgi:hypothetical protein
MGLQQLNTRQTCREGAGGDLPASLALFIAKLPPTLEQEQPVPDIDYLMDLIVKAKLASDGRGEGEEGRENAARKNGSADGALMAAASDIFHLRHARIKAEAGR